MSNNQFTTILLKRNSDTVENFDISEYTNVLERGEPFVDTTTNFMYIGDGFTPLNQLTPINISANIIATQSVNNGEHIFTINQKLSNNMKLFNFICNFNASYTVGNTIKLVVNGKTYQATLKLMDGNEPVTGCFKANTVNQMFVALNETTCNLFIQSAIAIWSI